MWPILNHLAKSFHSLLVDRNEFISQGVVEALDNYMHWAVSARPSNCVHFLFQITNNVNIPECYIAARDSGGANCPGSIWKTLRILGGGGVQMQVPTLPRHSWRF
jgi:hypothetical protein